LSGPAALQASLHWNPGDPVTINFLPDPPDGDLSAWLIQQKSEGNRSEIRNLLAQFVPQRFAEAFCTLHLGKEGRLTALSHKTIEVFCQKLQVWTFVPKSTVGFGKAEVTKGGVDTRELSSKTMESRKVPGLYFIGEVVDVTGWLGGYNFQWAWASGAAAGRAV
jgi:predicted Rossmann fold flavoprotein